MRNTLIAAIALTTVAIGSAQAQNLTVPAGDAAFNNAPTAAVTTDAASRYAPRLTTGRSVYVGHVRAPRNNEAY